jgi:hypothetical protein
MEKAYRSLYYLGAAVGVSLLSGCVTMPCTCVCAPDSTVTVYDPDRIEIEAGDVQVDSTVNLEERQ